MLKNRPHSSSLRDHVPQFLLWRASQRSSQPPPLNFSSFIPYVHCVLTPAWLCHEYIMALAPTAVSAAKSLQSCPTLCSPIDGRPPNSSVPGILQARTPEWVAISFSLIPTTTWQLSMSHAQEEKADWLSWVFRAESPSYKSWACQNGCLWARYPSQSYSPVLEWCVAVVWGWSHRAHGSTSFRTREQCGQLQSMPVALTAARILIPSRVFGGNRVECLPPPTPIATQHSPSCFFPPTADLLCFSHFICCLSLFSCNENARVANPSFRNMVEANSQASKYDRFLLLYPFFFFFATLFFLIAE